MDLPEFADEGVENTKQQARNLISWLPDPHTCDCGALCKAKTEYVENQAMHMDVWDCPECEKRYYRDETTR